MSYKTILVHVDASRHLEGRVALAAAIARAQEAHLIGAAVSGMSHTIANSETLVEGDANLAHFLDILLRQSEQALERFAQLADQAGVASVERRRVDDEVGEAISLQARYADLVVLSQPDPAERLMAMAGFPDYVLMHGGRPVLLVPYAGRFERIGRHAVVAWDASLEAARAITAALPLLERALTVQVVVFNPDPERHGQEPGADIALYLARHGVRVTVSSYPTDIDVGNALLSLCSDCAADLLVMGAYAHSRRREIVLGGVTRTVLASMPLPVLMAH